MEKSKIKQPELRAEIKSLINKLDENSSQLALKKLCNDIVDFIENSEIEINITDNMKESLPALLSKLSIIRQEYRKDVKLCKRVLRAWNNDNIKHYPLFVNYINANQKELTLKKEQLTKINLFEYRKNILLKHLNAFATSESNNLGTDNSKNSLKDILLYIRDNKAITSFKDLVYRIIDIHNDEWFDIVSNDKYVNFFVAILK